MGSGEDPLAKAFYGFRPNEALCWEVISSVTPSCQDPTQAKPWRERRSSSHEVLYLADDFKWKRCAWLE
jgi:hypothetical protein